MESDCIIASAEFSEDQKYRYSLTRTWDITRKHIVCIGLNPSTADESNDDTTITNLCTLLEQYGYGGFTMLNLYALITTNGTRY